VHSKAPLLQPDPLPSSTAPRSLNAGRLKRPGPVDVASTPLRDAHGSARYSEPFGAVGCAVKRRRPHANWRRNLALKVLAAIVAAVNVVLVAMLACIVVRRGSVVGTAQGKLD
jgi:hypothetical protein